MLAEIDPVPVTPLPLRPDARYGVEAYGMLWWLSPEPIAYMTKGFLDTNCYAFPEYDVVIARMQRVEASTPIEPYAFSRVADIARQLVSQ